MTLAFKDGGELARLIRFVDDMDPDTAAVFDSETNLVRINRVVYDRLPRWEQSILLFTKCPLVVAAWVGGTVAIAFT